MLSFIKKKTASFPQMVISFYIIISYVWELQLFHSLSNIRCQSFYLCYITNCIMVLHWLLICILLITNDVDHFLCPFWPFIYIYLSWSICLNLVPVFPLGCFCFYCWVVGVPFISWILVLCQIDVLWISSSILWLDYSYK